MRVHARISADRSLRDPAHRYLVTPTAPGAGGLTFLPFLGFGEQGALWDPSLRGTIAWITLAHTREDGARALLEGIAIEFRRSHEFEGVAETLG